MPVGPWARRWPCSPPGGHLGVHTPTPASPPALSTLPSVLQLGPSRLRRAGSIRTEGSQPWAPSALSSPCWPPGLGCCPQGVTPARALQWPDRCGSLPPSQNTALQ